MSTPTKAPPADELFAGLSGSLVDDNRPPARVTFDALLGAGFEPKLDLERISTSLCRVEGSGRAGVWPVVCPSVELYGAVAGCMVEERPVPPAAADAGDGAGAGAGAASSASSSSSSSSSSATAPELVPALDRNLYEPYRWMFSPPNERAGALEDRLEEMSAALHAQSGLRPGTMSVGRLTGDADNADKITGAGSIALELSRKAGNTRMVLDLHEVDASCLFPGEIVGVRGSAPSADKLVAAELVTSAPAPRLQTPYANAAALHKVRSAGGPVRVWVGAGPYTATDDITFGPLTDLLAEVREADPAPDVLLLLGPFLDADHPQVKSGAMEYKSDDVSAPFSIKDAWKLGFLSVLSAYLGEDGNAGRTEVVLIPAPNDAISEPVFPQWPLPRSLFPVADDEFASLIRRITVLPNPATFVVGDVVFGSTSVDVLSHLNAEATPSSVKPPAGGAGAGAARPPDRFESLVRAVLGQRSFYPLFPTGGGAPGTAEGALPLELTKVWHAGMNVRPDILVLPTRRLGKPACVRVVGDTLVVNPGPVARAAAGARAAGMFAKVCIFPGEKPSLATSSVPVTEEGEDYAVSSALSRVRAEIVKLQ